MGAFNYTALDINGKTVKGVMQGDSARVIRQKLRAKELNPLELTPVVETKQRATSFLQRRSKHIALPDLALLTRQLATLLAAGLPIVESLQGVSEQVEKAPVKSILQGVRARVLEGHSLANAMSKFPNAFPELYCATVGSGEQTGRLHLVLTRLAEYTEQQQQMRQKIQQALIYPALMTFVSIGIVSFLLVFVVPKIIDVFSSTGQHLPDTTLFLISISNALKNYGLYLLIFIGVALFVFKRLLRREAFRTKWHTFLLRLPIIGYSIKTINTARFARTFGILTAAGVEVLEAMRVSATLITNIPMRQAVLEAANRVKEGTNINYALKLTSYFSPMTIHLISTGEASGRLEEMLERAANSQDADVTRLIETGLTLFEPIIILAMGAVVLFIVLAILLPIFELNQFAG